MQAMASNYQHPREAFRKTTKTGPSVWMEDNGCSQADHTNAGGKEDED